MIQIDARNIDFGGMLSDSHLFAKHDYFQLISNKAQKSHQK